ncbi:MAG: hypothetical protein ACOX19_07610 [Fermentimonas sp.]
MKIEDISIFEKPKILLVPSLDWKEPNSLLVSRDYEEKKSKPEWGFSITKNNRELLTRYQFGKVVKGIINNNGT